MSGASFIKYSLESILRNRRRSLYAIVGIVLALSLVTGSSIAVDSSASAFLRATLREVPVDFVAVDNKANFSTNSAYLKDRADALASVQDVELVSPTVIVDGFSLLNSAGKEYQSPWFSQSPAFFLPTDSARFRESFRLSGAPPGPGTVAVPEDVAASLNLTTGQNISLSTAIYNIYYDPVNDTWVGNNTYLNLSYMVSGIWSQERTDNSFDERAVVLNLEAGGASFVSPIFFNMSDMGAMLQMTRNAGAQVRTYLEFLVWIDRDAVISLADITETVDSLSFMERRLRVQSAGYDLTVYESGLVWPLKNLGQEFEYNKLLFVAFSLPVIALGTYLSVVGVELGVTSRRREAGILKSRGASNRQVFGSLAIEALTLGSVAGIAGLLIGVVVSRFLLGSTMAISSSPFELTPGDISLTDLHISFETIVMAIFFGVLLMLVSSYSSFKKVARMNVAETLHHYSPAAVRLDYKPWKDVAMVGVSAWSILSIMAGADWAENSGYSWIVEAIVTVLLTVGSLLIFVMPFLLSFGLVRLLTRGTRKLYTKFTRIVKPWTKELHYLVDRNIARNPRRASNLCIIISLSLAFALFISITADSSVVYERDCVRYEIGGDANVEVYNWQYTEQPISAAAIKSLATVSGVESSAAYVNYQMGIDGYAGQTYVTVAAIDPSDYLDSVKPGRSYFLGGGNEMLLDLEQNGTALLTEEVAEQNDILVGENVLVLVDSMVDQSYTQYRFRMNVVGLVKGLPGLSMANMFVDGSSLSFLAANNITVDSFWRGAILGFGEGADGASVRDAVEQRFAARNYTASVRLLEERLADLDAQPGFRSLSDFLYTEYVLSIVTMSVGVGLIIFVAVMDREHELACIMARGASSRQVRKVLIGESVSIMSLGLLVGASIGLLTAYLFNKLLTGDGPSAVDRSIVISLGTLIIFVISVASLLLASLLATSRAGKIKLSEVLRIRGG